MTAKTAIARATNQEQQKPARPPSTGLVESPFVSDLDTTATPPYDDAVVTRALVNDENYLEVMPKNSGLSAWYAGLKVPVPPVVEDSEDFEVCCEAAHSDVTPEELKTFGRLDPAFGRAVERAIAEVKARVAYIRSNQANPEKPTSQVRVKLEGLSIYTLAKLAHQTGMTVKYIGGNASEEVAKLAVRAPGAYTVIYRTAGSIHDTDEDYFDDDGEREAVTTIYEIAIVGTTAQHAKLTRLLAIAKQTGDAHELSESPYIRLVRDAGQPPIDQHQGGNIDFDCRVDHTPGSHRVFVEPARWFGPYPGLAVEAPPAALAQLAVHGLTNMQSALDILEPDFPDFAAQLETTLAKVRARMEQSVMRRRDVSLMPPPIETVTLKTTQTEYAAISAAHAVGMTVATDIHSRAQIEREMNLLAAPGEKLVHYELTCCDHLDYYGRDFLVLGTPAQHAKWRRELARPESVAESAGLVESPYLSATGEEDLDFFMTRTTKLKYVAKGSENPRRALLAVEPSSWFGPYADVRLEVPPEVLATYRSHFGGYDSTLSPALVIRLKKVFPEFGKKIEAAEQKVIAQRTKTVDHALVYDRGLNAEDVTAHTQMTEYEAADAAHELGMTVATEQSSRDDATRDLTALKKPGELVVSYEIYCNGEAGDDEHYLYLLGTPAQHMKWRRTIAKAVPIEESLTLVESPFVTSQDRADWVRDSVRDQIGVAIALNRRGGQTYLRVTADSSYGLPSGLRLPTIRIKLSDAQAAHLGTLGEVPSLAGGSYLSNAVLEKMRAEYLDLVPKLTAATAKLTAAFAAQAAHVVPGEDVEPAHRLNIHINRICQAASEAGLYVAKYSGADFHEAMHRLLKVAGPQGVVRAYRGTAGYKRGNLMYAAGPASLHAKFLRQLNNPGAGV